MMATLLTATGAARLELQKQGGIETAETKTTAMLESKSEETDSTMELSNATI